MIKRYRVLLPALCCLLIAQAQSFGIEDWKNKFGKGKPFKLSGGFSANSVFNAGNEAQERDLFAYYLSGNINLNLYGLINLPFSFHLTNSGTSYKLPSSPNRLSITPSYKWITGYIGDVSMTFSPYTLSGHLFTGAGVELKPEGWEFAAMYGRLLKAVEYDETHPGILPAYKRMAYGLKVGRASEKYQLSINMLNAKDVASSLLLPPDSLGITPKENLAGSLSFKWIPVQFVEINGEYGLSLLTTDQRSPEEKRSGILGLWNASNLSSSYYNAIKAQVNLVGENNSIGLGYERIDPNYQTLGAYYFVNDIENITVNASQSFLQKKMTLSLSVGYEHDDLAKNKANISSRIVASANLTANLGEKVNANLSYSNFQSYTNVRSNFELINRENPLDLLDTLNFVQLSQNVNVAIGILTRRSEKRQDNLNLNFSYQDAANKQGGIYRPGSVSEMINAIASYSVYFLPSKFILSGILNFNNSRIQNTNALTFGPSLDAAFMLKKKINIKNTISYNSGFLEGVKQNDVFIYRLNSSYMLLQKHNFTFAYNFQWRSAQYQKSRNNSLLTFGYTYNF